MSKDEVHSIILSEIKDLRSEIRDLRKDLHGFKLKVFGFATVLIAAAESFKLYLGSK